MPKGLYEGSQINIVLKDGQPLDIGPSRKLVNKSTEFSWGFGGSGPAQLALALLYDVTGDHHLSLDYYQDFKWSVVAGWSETWVITREEILKWIADKKAYVKCAWCGKPVKLRDANTTYIIENPGGKTGPAHANCKEAKPT
jgi:hypothetical protein